MKYKLNKKTLLFERISFIDEYKKYLLIIPVFMIFGFSTAIKTNVFIEKLPVLIKSDSLEFSDSLLKVEIAKLNLKFPEIIYAQYKLESNNGTSIIFKENSNLFGMKLAKSRPTIAIGENRGHAVFTNWKECLIDYALWQLYMPNCNTENEYYQLLDSIYAEDGSYIQKLKKIILIINKN